jgi:(R,R)-butanediol dehydrogenase/meso-butanediol dehydrogenase/diacetyl reductase
VRAGQAFEAPGLTAVQAAVVEPAAVALEALLRGGVGDGSTVLVVGAGPIGALAVLGALALDASRVIVSDPQSWRLAKAVELGGVALDEEGRLGALVDVALDCAGKPGSIELALRSVRHGGDVVIPAVHSEPRMVDLWGVTRRMITITGSLGYTSATFGRVIDLVGAGRLPVERVVTRQAPRESIIEAGFEAMRPGHAEALKTLIEVAGDG